MSRAPSPLALARLDLLDGVRNRRQLLIRAVTPLLLLVSLMAMTALAGGGDQLAKDTYLVTVSGDVAGARATLDALVAASGNRIEVAVAADPHLALVSGADLSLVLPDELDTEMAGSDPIDLTLVSAADDKDSRAAATLVRSALAEVVRPLPENLALDARDVQEDLDRGAADLVAQAAAALVLLQGGILIGTSASRFTSKRATGTLAPHLLLPVPRRRLALSRGVCELTLGLLAGLPLLILVGLAAITVLLVAGEPAAVVATVILMPAAAVGVAAPLVGLGVALGARARSHQQSSALTAGGLVVVALMARYVALLPESAPTWVAAVPVAGPAKVLRDGVSGDLQVVALALAVLTTAAFTALVTTIAARSLDRDDLALRLP